MKKKDLKVSESAYCFLAIGKTQESKEASEGFKRYIGVGSTFVRGVQPTKAEIDEFFGYDSQSEPEYIKDTDNGKEVHVTFLLQADPALYEGIDLKTRAMFTLRAQPAYNRDQTKVQILDQYGNHTWVDVETAKAGKAIITANGNPAKIDTKYRMALDGECDLVDFLKKYLCVQDAFNYVNGTWVKKENAAECVFGLENIKDYFKGDFSELKEALALQPNNKVQLLYGVRTTDEGKQYQAVCTKGDFILSNSAGTNALTKLAKDLADAKQRGSYQNTDYRVQELQEYVVEPTNLNSPSQGDSDGLPFETGSQTDDIWNTL